MPADEVTHGTDVDASRVRTGPRHAAPKKPLFTRLHMPAGKAIATVAMPTAVIMGMGFTSSLALADNGSTTSPSSKSLTADEYKDCVSALAGSTAGATPSASPSTSASDSAKDDATPSATATDSATKDSGKTSSSDSGSDDTAKPTPSATASKSADTSGSSSSTATATPSASASSGNLLDTIGDAITGILTGGSSSSDSTASATPTPTASASASTGSDDGSSSASDTVKNTTKKVTDTVDDTVKDTTDTATKAADEATKAAEDTATATATPSASASESADTSDCPVATDDTSGVDNKILVPDDPWYLNASSLLLKGADYKGVVEVKTASGKVKKVLKYVISGGTDIGDLHQTVNDKQSGKTYHVKAAKGSTSTIRDGDTVMYTQSISGNLFGLIPITFDPDNPPPLNIPLIYFTNVKVVQAGQFGGTLTVPGLQSYQD
ncbi:hypothetical protein SAMN05216489_06855 [Streptomyces sp. 3213]|uniref:hypothetical protein n=1 Tax=Streptomyces sp. 3213.3 TaxID=1855348 RepID=UPI00089933F4|nr:hypothetical protein [Streptomyces sp. 3213.3]SEE49964.1 hypothetical protein SAMN05216489_06855 [Streptomyces sp. 3213] [Streptomyces sp. 3213.3]